MIRMRRLVLSLALAAVLPALVWTGTAGAGLFMPERTLQSGAGAIADGAEFEVSGLVTISVDVSGTFVGTIDFEADYGGGYRALTCYDTTSSPTGVTAVTATGVWRCNVTGANTMRAPISAYTSGTITVKAHALAGGFVRADPPGGGGGGGSGTVTSVDASGGVETAGGVPITGTGTIREAHEVETVSAGTYSFVSGDRGKVKNFTAADPAATLPQAGVSFPSGWPMTVVHQGSGTLTITPTTSTINGAATLTLTTGQSCDIRSDGTNYIAACGKGTGAGGGISSLGGQTGATQTFGNDTNVQMSSALDVHTLTWSGILARARGGTGQSTSPDNNMLIGDGSLWLLKTIPDCDNAMTSKMLYDQTTRAWSCGTDQAAAGGMSIGGAVTGGTAQNSLHIDVSGNLAQQKCNDGEVETWSSGVRTCGTINAAPSDATFWTGSACAGCSAEHSLAGITGIVKSTAGTPSQAVAGTDYSTPTSTESFQNKTIDCSATGMTCSNFPGGGTNSFALAFNSGSGGTYQFTVADGTTYFIGMSDYITSGNGADVTMCIPVPVTSTLTAVYWHIRINGAAGTSEDVTHYVRNATAATESTGVVIDWDANDKTGNETGLSMAFTAGQCLVAKVVTPTWATDPANVKVHGTAYFVVD